MSLPRLLVAAPSTGQGKTTVATGLMAALRSAGHTVSGHKVGPDYIDPGYHALATGRPGRNLDPHLVGEERIVPLLLHGARGADVAVIEGVMGLHDGRIGGDGFASSAHVATLTQTPVVLVLDIARLSRSAGAIAAGMAAYDPSVRVAGVILNRAGSARNVAEVARSLERTGLPVLGTLPRDERLAVPSRHLGLVPVGERAESARVVEHLGEQVARHLDLDALLEVAASAPDLAAAPWDAAREVRPSGPDRPVVAIAGGRAFTFRYAETEELLAAAGCEVVAFDPLTDPTLPAGTRGIYLGGGFPEMYAARLAANRRLLDDLAAAVRDGVPTVAECAGLLYLAESLDGVAMAGIVPAAATMSASLTLRYPVATAVADSLLSRAGERVTGHEFHRTRTSPDAGTAWEVEGHRTGFATSSWHASYLHVHWAGHPALAQRFADAVHAGGARASGPTRRGNSPLHTGDTPSTARPRSVTGSHPRTDRPDDAADRPADPLRHHGDAETGPGLLDFAVNVYPEPRPDWLDRAVADSLAAIGSYPDAAPARDAVARRHGAPADEVLVTAGAAEAFWLLARLRPWQRPVVVHPQFTEPHAALEQAGCRVTSLVASAEQGFRLDPDAVPEDADLVVVGNPTNPTGVLHRAAALRSLCRPGRLVVVDEAFMDAVPGEPETQLSDRPAGLLVVRSLTKHWSIPGVRAGYLLGDSDVVAGLAALQPPWSVSAPAVAAVLACTSRHAAPEARQRAERIARWRAALEQGLRERGIDHVPSAASFVLARLGPGVRAELRGRGVVVRRADTFPGLDASWARIAVRPPALTGALLAALDHVRQAGPAVPQSVS